MAPKQHGGKRHGGDPPKPEFKPICDSKTHVHAGGTRNGSPYARPYVEVQVDPEEAVYDEMMEAARCVVAMYATDLIADDPDYASEMVMDFANSYLDPDIEPHDVLDVFEPTYARVQENMSNFMRTLFRDTVRELREKRAMVFEYRDGLFDGPENWSLSEDAQLELVVLAGDDTGFPLAFATDIGTKGNRPSRKKALDQLGYLNLRTSVVVTDRSMESEAELASMLQSKLPIIGEVPISYSWVQKAVDEHFDELRDMFTFMTDVNSDSIHLVTIPLTLDLDELSGNETKVTNDRSKGNKRKVFLHLYYDELENLVSRAELGEAVRDAATAIRLAPDPIEEFDEFVWAQDLLSVEIGEDGERAVRIDRDACEALCKYAGFTALLASREEDGEKAFTAFEMRRRFGRLMDKGPVSEDTVVGNKLVHLMALAFWESATMTAFGGDEDAAAYSALYGPLLYDEIPEDDIVFV